MWPDSCLKMTFFSDMTREILNWSEIVKNHYVSQIKKIAFSSLKLRKSNLYLAAVLFFCLKLHHLHLSTNSKNNIIYLDAIHEVS